MTVYIETPQSVLDDHGIDVFERIIPNTAYDYQKKHDELWAKYRYRGIGSCDRDYWIQCMTDRYTLIEDTWDVKIKAWEAYQSKIAADGIDFSQSSGESRTHTLTEREDTPDNPAGTTVYLSDRSNVTTDYIGKNFEGLESETTDDYIKRVPDPWDGFTSQFVKLFYFGV